MIVYIKFVMNLNILANSTPFRVYQFCATWTIVGQCFLFFELLHFASPGWAINEKVINKVPKSGRKNHTKTVSVSMPIITRAAISTE